MPIKFNFHKCGANLRVPEKHIGKKARCPKCDEKCVVPESSQRSESGIGMGAQFEDIGNFLDQPPAATPVSAPAANIPAAMPVAAAPAMATPVAPPPMSAPAVSSGVQSPYHSPMSSKPGRRSKGGGGGGYSSGVMQPLYEARTMMKIWGWMNFIIGILYCLTIFGAVIGWLFIWMGWLVKGAGEAVTIGIETGDSQQLRLANERLGTFFKIMGVLAIIGLVMIGLYLLFAILGIILMIVGAAAA